MDILFMLLASGCWVSAYLMISSKNPVYSVFYLVLVFLHLSGLLCLIGLEYFLLLQLLVYVGLLLIMFLFVVMLLHIPATEILAHQRGAYPVAGVLLLCFVLALRLAYNQEARSGRAVLQYERTDALAHSAVDWKVLNLSTSSVAVLGSSLYSVHVDLLLLLSLLLLIAMVGLVLLTLKRRARAPVHDVFVQHSVDFQKVVYALPMSKGNLRSSFELCFSSLYGAGSKEPGWALPWAGPRNYKIIIQIESFCLFMRNTSRSFRGSLFGQPLLNVVQNHLISYPTPSNLTGNWNWGVLAGLCLVLQIVTGIFLAMHYTAHVDYAFHSVQHLMRDVPNGWLLRYLHLNGLSLFFIVVYMHLFRGLYYTSYAQPREAVWLLGVIILLLMILTRFIGYVLPWGQMSLWGRTVITSLASAIPVVGTSIVHWLWGGFSVDNPTLNRFYSLHYLMPFILAALSLAHLALLHQYGSTNPLGISAQTDLVDFYPYFYTKDLVLLIALALLAMFLVCFYPEVLGHTDNNIPANPYSTPAHIVPEWYLLGYYAILRSIPNKLAGVLAMLLVFICLGLLPWAHKPNTRGPQFRLIHQVLRVLLAADYVLLSYLGACPVEHPYVLIGQILTRGFFGLLLTICALSYLDTLFALSSGSKNQAAEFKLA